MNSLLGLKEKYDSVKKGKVSQINTTNENM